MNGETGRGVLPRLKQVRAEPGAWWTLPYKGALHVANHGASAETADTIARQIREWTRLEVVRRNGAGAARLVRSPRAARKHPAMGPEGYTLAVARDGIALTAGSDEGLLYAAQSLLGLLELHEGTWRAPVCEIRDWPDCAWRGFMADPARCFIPLDRMKWVVDLMARNKMNRFHIHFTDAESFTLPSRRYPRLNRIPAGPYGVYTRDEIRSLVAHAAARGVVIVPEIEMPGHARYLARAYPELRCKVRGEEASDWALCAGAESTYAFLERLFDEILPLFPGPWVHIGGDELDYAGRVHNVWVSWRECSECRARMRREGLRGIRQLFYYFVRRVHGILRSHGKTLVMWNENIAIGDSPDLPRDILIQFWRVAHRGWGPRKGVNMQRFAREGFRIVNSFYPDTYLDFYAKDERMFAWHPQSNFRFPRALRPQVIGSEACAWGENGFDNYIGNLPGSLALFGDRLWNRRPVTDPDGFAEAAMPHLFGPFMPPEWRRFFHARGFLVQPATQRFLAAPPVLKGLPAGERHALCVRLIRGMEREQRSPRIRNRRVLGAYAGALRQGLKSLAKRKRTTEQAAGA